MAKALVIGAGIAGPTVAVALRKIGMDVEVFEQQPADADQRGSWLNFQANGSTPCGPSGPPTGSKRWATRSTR